ncbi:MAG TPA: ATP-binding protein [Streptosporangiaceae bacterium]|nr:ATP-binding protein [Streptosporangiaceae bacterium]
MTKKVSRMLTTCSAADIYDLTRAMPEGAHLELGALMSAVPAARTWARVLWSGWGLARLADDAGLVLSELVTNSLLHAFGRTVDIWLRSDRESLAIMVGDPCPDMPAVAETEDDYELSGRGLIIVSVLAEHWGAYRVPLGKVVWAVLT